MLRFLSAGESHGKAQIAILEGIVAGLSITNKDIQKELDKRKGGQGRGGRRLIETDTVEILSGVRLGKTLGSPICLIVKNNDYANWQDKMNPDSSSNLSNDEFEVNNPRPGHADLAGCQKYNFTDVRNVLERASARETVMRVAVGAICKKFLTEFGIEISSKVIQIGQAKESIEMEKEIEKAISKKDTLGGAIEIIIHNVPVGLGSHVHWDRKLDALLTQAVMSIPSVKAVEIGEGIKGSSQYGSQVHDEIFYNDRFYRKTNNCGGIEGGISNGEDIIIKMFLKPIATLSNPLSSIDIKTKKETKAVCERSDTCVVLRAGVIGEAMCAYILSKEFLEKYGGDSITETKKHFLSFHP